MSKHPSKHDRPKKKTSLNFDMKEWYLSNISMKGLLISPQLHQSESGGGQAGQIVNNFKSVKEALSGRMLHLSGQILPVCELSSSHACFSRFMNKSWAASLFGVLKRVIGRAIRLAPVNQREVFMGDKRRRRSPAPITPFNAARRVGGSAFYK